MKTFLFALLLLVSAAAQPHLMPAGQGAVRVVGDSAFLVMSVPVALLSGVDDDGDRRLSLAELAAHRSEISKQVGARLAVSSSGQAGELLFEDLLLSHGDDHAIAPAENLIVMRRYRWSQVVDGLRVTASLFDLDQRQGRLLLQALRGEQRASVQLDREHDSAGFFAEAGDSSLTPSRATVAAVLLALLLPLPFLGLWRRRRLVAA